MKVLLVSFAVGLFVGVLYGVIRVKSPAPPIVALLGLLGMVLGEQLGIWVHTRKVDVPRAAAVCLVGESSGIPAQMTPIYPIRKESQFPQYPWQASYAASLVDVRPDRVKERIAVAENAINDRLEDSLHGRQVLGSSERSAIMQALSHLRSLKQDIAATSVQKAFVVSDPVAAQIKRSSI